ncbi:30811_t:CDS:2 [Gigaspora margarita]|uniref:30811_t:CDS:1 n=1 Tax=Gigaspora margarita TaxID=4874 RepID=A0ABN7V7X0_GIGMA|nr:30811_t:CDS:2 [Gigaspora margarita]
MPTNYIDVNYTDKPPLLWDPRKILEVKIKTPITQPKELTELVCKLHPRYHFIRIPENWLKLPPREPKPDQLENNHKIPDNMETIREMIKEMQPEMEVTLPITKYEDIERTVEILKIKFDISNILQNLLQLPELDKPEWNLQLKSTSVSEQGITLVKRNYGRQHGKNNIKIKGLEKTGKN